MLLTRRNPDHVTGPNLLDRPSPALRAATSRAMQGVEGRSGVRLVARRARSVGATRAGERLIARVRAAFGDIRGAVGLITGVRERPAGRVRLVVSPIAATTVLAPELG